MSSINIQFGTGTELGTLRAILRSVLTNNLQQTGKFPADPPLSLPSRPGKCPDLDTADSR